MNNAAERNIDTHITIFRFPMAEAAAKSRGEGKSPKLVSSDHCHMSGINITSINPHKS